ncbi:MAG: hypothetical protein IT365_06995 [Candidatus Hydrogenedentes bacterium]|nr:hypothetical protein [Candidatus Hydrogenedentota bacterium]
MIMERAADPKLLLRLAHSHREKAQALIEDCGRTLAEGSIDATRHAELLAEYRRELAQAEAMLDRFRGLERARVAGLEAELRVVRAQRTRLPEEVSAGKISAEKANDRNRNLLERISNLESHVQETRARIEARTAEALGGFIDLPFERYAAEMSVASRTREQADYAASMPPKRWEMAAITIACLTACAAVFLPWLQRGADSLSLFEVGYPLARGAVPDLLRYAWLAYLIVPWIAVAVLLRARTAVIGWGILVCGLLLLAGAVYPAALFGASRMHEGDILQLLSAFKAGEALYGVSALLLIVMGSLRVSPWRDSLSHAAAASGVLAAGVAGIFLAGLALVYFMPPSGAIRFDASISTPVQDRIVVHCVNEGDSAVALVVPWTDDGPSAAPGYRAATTYGVNVHVRERGASSFRLLPPSRLPWSVPGTPALEGDFLEVGKGLRQELMLDLRQLSALGADVSAIRLEFTRGDGDVAGTFESETSDRYLSPPPQSREPILLPVPSPPPVELPPQPTVSETAPATTAGPGATSEPAAPTITLEYTGTVGDKVAVRVTGPEPGATKTRLVSVGEEAASGCYLVGIENTPTGVAIRLELMGESVTLQRGESAQVAATP